MPLEIWFLNVGHGNCTIVGFPSGRMAMVDINNAPALDEESAREIAVSAGGLTETEYLIQKVLCSGVGVVKTYESLLVNPCDFWLQKFGREPIFRLIVTHPDMDHLSGLYRLTCEDKVPIWNLWDTNHGKEIDEESFRQSPYDYRDWFVYQCLRGTQEGMKTLSLRRLDHGDYWSGDGITILSPTRELEEEAAASDDWHHLSYILRIEYGRSVVILTGDPSVAALKDVYMTFPDEFLRAGLLLAPHHGRDTGYYSPLVKAISPKYTIVSVGKKPENDASNKYRQYSDCVLSTRFHGTIHAKCWYDGDIWVYDHQGNLVGG